jgi:iron(III) transport system substrate-binding protein
MTKHLFAIVAVLVLVVNPTLGFAQEDPVEMTECDASGSFLLYTSESEDDVSNMVGAFNEVCQDVEVEVFRSGSGEVVARIQAEMEAGEIQADMIWFADIDFFSQLAAEDLMLAYRPETADEAGVAEELHYNDDQYHEVRQIFNVVAYNTTLVDEAPTSWKDLLDPAYEGMVAMPSALYSGAAFNQVGTLVNDEAFGWDFYNQLNDNGVVVGQGNGGIADGLATGEYAMVQVVDFMVRDRAAQGSPVAHIWPEEGAVLIPTPIGIMSSVEGTEREAATKAFMDFLYTASAQELFVEQGYIPVAEGAPLPEGTPNIEDLSIITVDVDYIGENREGIRTTFAETFNVSGPEN